MGGGCPSGVTAAGTRHTRTMNFEGLLPLAEDQPLIEIEINGWGCVDLYNEHHLQPVVIDGDSLRFPFVHRRDGSRVMLTFLGVRNLSLTRPPDWHPREACQIDHLQVRPEGREPRVRFLAGGDIYEFDSTGVRAAKQ